MKELKSYKREVPAVIWLNGKKHNFTTTEEFVNYPLADLLNLRDRLKHPSLFKKLFGYNIYDKFALEDVERAINGIGSIETEYKYIKELTPPN